MTSRNSQFVKIVLSVIVIFIIILILHVFINNYLNQVNKQLEENINTLVSSLKDNDFSASMTIVRNLKNTWDTYAGILPIFIDHTDIDFVSQTIIQLESFVQSEEASLAQDRAVTISEKLRNIKLKEKLTLLNIF